MEMESLSFHDFRDAKFDPNWSRFDCLLLVAKVAKEKMQRQNFRIRNGEEKKSHDFGYLKKKYFLYNAPQRQTLSKQENMGFNNNVGLLQKKRKLKEKEEDGEWEELKQKVKKSKKEKPAVVCPIPPPDLPDDFKQHIVEKMGGSGWILVIQKPIFFSDVNRGASRFSIPFSQLKVKTHEFLNKAEAEDLDAKKAMEVCLLEPSMKETTVSFNRWYMGKSSSYVMTTKWNSVVKNNRLKIGDIVQLWSFRVNSKLCFALVKQQVPTRN